MRQNLLVTLHNEVFELYCTLSTLATTKFMELFQNVCTFTAEHKLFLIFAVKAPLHYYRFAFEI